jgi:peptidase inhibitor family I36
MKRLFAVAAPALLLVFGLAGAAPAAMAATHPGTSQAKATAVMHPAAVPAGCTSTNLCFWNNAGFNDGPGRLSGTNSSWFSFSHSSCPNGTWADCVSSIFNDGSSCTARVWFLSGFGAPTLSIARGNGFSNLTQVQTGLGVSWNDEIEANDWVC